MGSSSGTAGLKCFQWVSRAVQFVCSVVVLGINSYYLASMLRSDTTVPTSVKAVEGISAAGTIYGALGVLLTCCCAGRGPALSFAAAVLDVGLAGAFVYVAVASRAGASSCSGASVDSVYGSGQASARPSAGGDGGGDGGVFGLPTYGMACRLQTACLAAACVAILFFLLSILLEISMNRNRHRASRPIRDADGEYLSKSAAYYTGDTPAPYGGGGAPGAFAPQLPPPQRRDAWRQGGGFLAALRRQKTYRGAPMEEQQPDRLPAHQQPRDVVPVETWGEVVSLHSNGNGGGGSDELFFNEAREPGPPVRFTPTTAPRPAAGVCEEGALPADAEGGYNLYGREDGRQGDGLQGDGVGGWSGRVHRESREARMERFAVA